jgi:transposase
MPKRALSQAQVIGILDEVTGINQRIAQIVVAELGTQLDQFPSEAHLVSWAGLCPAAKISAGKRLSTRTGKGNRWLRQALIEAVHGAARSKNTFLGAYYQRLKKRMGSKKAIVALAHRVLVIIYHLLKEQQSYRELGPGHADEQAAASSKRWAMRRLEQLGYRFCQLHHSQQTGISRGSHRGPLRAFVIFARQFSPYHSHPLVLFLL